MYSAERAAGSLHHSFHVTGVQVNDEHSQEGHLFARVLKNNARVVRLAPEAVGGHHHGQVVHIHLGDRYVGWLSKHLRMEGGNSTTVQNVPKHRVGFLVPNETTTSISFYD